jgi:hypothetical protein
VGGLDAGGGEETFATRESHTFDASSFSPGMKAISVRACNAAGLCSSSESAATAQFYVASTPVGGEVRVHNVNQQGTLIGMQIVGSWEVTAPELSYEACVGTTPYGCQVVPFTATAGESRFVVSPDTPLPCGATFYMTVRATNCAGMQRTVASTGTKVCCAVPVRGRIAIEDVLTGDAVEFAANASELRVAWSGFSEPCSGMRGYTASLETLESVLWTSGEISSSLDHVAIPGSIVSSLTQGTRYVVRVIAAAHSGLVLDQSAQLAIDSLSPKAATVVDGVGPVDLTCTSASLRRYCAWSLPDVELGRAPLVSIEWALGSSLNMTALKDFEAVPLASRSASARVESAIDSLVFCTIRLRNAVGLSTTSSSDGAIVVNDTQCDAPYSCLPNPGSLLSVASPSDVSS